MSQPRKWADPANKLFPHQVGFTAPPMDFDAAPSDFLRLCPPTVGVHARLLHVPGYAHRLEQRANNFHLLEEVVHCMSDAGVDVVGQVGTNWVHANGTDVHDIRRFVSEVSEKYETPFHMAGMTLVDACGNFVDQGWYSTQQEVNDLTWIFPGELALDPMQHTIDRAPDVDTVVVNGMSNSRDADGQPRRLAGLAAFQSPR